MNPPAESDDPFFDSDESLSEEIDENPWSPPQISLKTIFVVVVVCALVSWIVRVAGPKAVGPIIIISLCGWFVRGCIRLIRLSKKNSAKDDGPT